MSIHFHYLDYGGAFDVDLGESVRLGSIDGLVELAELGSVGNSNIVFDDPDSTLGYNSDGLVGHKLLLVRESAVGSNNQVMYAGLIGQRIYRSGDSLRQGVAAKTSPALMDLNALVDLRELRGHDWKRPAETAKKRLKYLLSVPAFSGITDQDFVNFPDHELDKADYRGQRPSAVLNDIVTPINWNWFVYWDDATSGPALFLDNSNRSAGYASEIRLSNVLADVDSWCDPATVGATKTFAVQEWPTLSRDPERVYSGVRVPYGRRSVYLSRDDVADDFIARDGTAPSGNIKTRAKALRLGTRYLNNSDEEADRIECAVMLPAANVNDIRAGHLIEAKFRNLKGYAAFNWFRVVERAVQQPDADDRYIVGLTLVPARPFTCAGLSDVNEVHGTMTAEVVAEEGNVKWAHATIPCLIGLCNIFPPDDPLSAIVVANPANANDGDTTTYSAMGQKVFRNAGTAAVYWTSTLDATYTVCSVKGTNQYGSSQWRARPPTSILYWSGTAWVTAVGSLSMSSPTSLPQWWTFTFHTPVDTTQIRLRYAQTGVPGAFGLWNFMPAGIRLYEMQIIGEAV